MSDTVWYIRLDAEAVGPVSEGELRELAERGGLTQETEVSREGTTWMPATRVPGLAFGPPPSSSSSPPMPKQAAAGQNPNLVWLIGAAVVGGGCVLLCGGLILGIVSESTDPGQSPQAAASSVDYGDRHTDWDYGLVPDTYVGGESASAYQDNTRYPTRTADLTVRCVDATDELVILASTLPAETRVAIGFAALMTGTDVYGARVTLRNTGPRPVRVFPQNIRMHFGGEAAQVYTIPHPRFLQPTILRPGESTSGLVSYVARMDIGAAMRLGGGGFSYSDTTISVTYE